MQQGIQTTEKSYLKSVCMVEQEQFIYEQYMVSREQEMQNMKWHRRLGETEHYAVVLS